jgi:hypothetical protein
LSDFVPGVRVVFDPHGSCAQDLAGSPVEDDFVADTVPCVAYRDPAPAERILDGPMSSVPGIVLITL